MSTRTPAQWILNLDAEEELDTAGPYRRSGDMRRILLDKRRALLGRLVLGDDSILEDDAAAPIQGPAISWCPTRSVKDQCQHLGIELRGALDPLVLAKVNGKAFGTRLAKSLPAADFPGVLPRQVCETQGQVERVLLQDHGLSDAALLWLARRNFGAAGRGQVRLAPGIKTPWIRTSLARGPLILEPWVEKVWEASTCGFIEPDGTVHMGKPASQLYTSHRTWIGSGPEPLESKHAESLSMAAHMAASALVDAGYHGPFGVDSFGYVDMHSKIRIQPISDLNARFTMAWPDSFPEWLRSGRLTQTHW